MYVIYKKVRGVVLFYTFQSKWETDVSMAKGFVTRKDAQGFADVLGDGATVLSTS